jgi:V8-like Glu-specific endopeptidase
MTDYSEHVDRITRAAVALDGGAARDACEDLIERIGGAAEPPSPVPMRKILSALRNKRYFDLMEAVASAVIASGLKEPQVRRQHAQGLIDQGKIVQAMSVLTDLVADTGPDGDVRNPSEQAEARGLLGRAHKQAYVNAVTRRSLIDTAGDAIASDAEYLARAEAYAHHLHRAIDEYVGVYESDVDRYLWQGINTVACVSRARRDGIARPQEPDAAAIAAAILDLLRAVEPRSNVAVWDRATALEACIALGRLAEALDWLAVYSGDERADAFEFASTLRQLTEVWQLDRDDEPGRTILPVLHAALLRREGGAVELSAGRQRVPPVAQEIRALEAVLGDTRFLPLAWYRTGLDRCSAVARIETKWGQGFGTGFLVRGGDLHHGLEGQVLLLTNAHVISDDPGVQKGNPPARAPERARVRFEAREADGRQIICAVKRLVWTSPPDQLDATLLELEPPQTCEPPYPLAVGLPTPHEDRVYVIGHPRGGGLSLSLQDNRVIDARAPKLHYRAPTEAGSSGSPVFNQDWELVALHHAGAAEMPNLSGTGATAANEGIWIAAIVEALQLQFQVAK